MLVYCTSSNCSRQIMLLSTSDKCHFVQHYKTLVGSRNIKNINLVHQKFYKLAGYLHWGFFFFFFFMRGKNSSANSVHGEDHWVQLQASPEDHFSRTHLSQTQKVKKVNVKGFTILSFYAGNSQQNLPAFFLDAFATATANRDGIAGAAVCQSCD